MQKHMSYRYFVTLLAFWSVLAIIASIGGNAQAEPLSLEVVGIDGHAFQLLNARVFVPTPTSCDSCPPKIIILDGIRVRDDKQTYIVPWNMIERVEKEKADTGTMTVVLIDGMTIMVELDEEREQFLSGDTRPDEYYAVPIRAVQRLNVIREH